MGIETGRTTRSRGALCMQVRLTDDATDCQLTASSRLQDGTALPSLVLRGGDEGCWLLVLATLSVAQTVELTATSWEGTVVETESVKVRPLASRLGSAAGGIGRSRHEAGFPSLEAGMPLGEWNVRVVRLVRTPWGDDVCQGVAEMVSAGRDAVSGELAVRMLDQRGHGVSSASWIEMGDEVARVEGRSGFYRRRVGFSLVVPSQLTSLVVWIEPKEGSGIASGFACLGARELAALREAWRASVTSAANDPRYGAWLKGEHAASGTELEMQRAWQHEHALTFDVVVSLRGAKPEEVRATADSLLEQTYGAWHLLLVHSAGDKELSAVVRSLELADARIKGVPLAADFGPAAMTSAGIDAAAGDFVCLAEPGDGLAAEALFELARAVERDSQADVLYTDEDVRVRGRHQHPALKPDWDPDLALAMGEGYLGHLVAVRATLLRDLGQIESDLDGAQDLLVELYACERARHVCHVPKVLYHARGAGGTADEATLNARIRAVERHLAGAGMTATVAGSSRVADAREVTYALAEEPLVSVIIPNRDRLVDLRRCLRSLRERTAYTNYEVIIAENGSTNPETFEFYREAEAADGHVRTIFYQGDEFDYGRVVNFAASRCEGSYLCLLHSDVEITDDAWLTRLVALCERKGTGAAGGRLLYPDATVQAAGYHLAPNGLVAHDRFRAEADGGERGTSLLPHDVTAASGACFVVSMASFRKVGGMAVGLPPEECVADLCLRLWGRGLRVVLDPQVMPTHHQPVWKADGAAQTLERVRATGRLWESWPHPSATDPTLGPNLDPQSPYRALR